MAEINEFLSWLSSQPPETTFKQIDSYDCVAIRWASATGRDINHYRCLPEPFDHVILSVPGNRTTYQQVLDHAKKLGYEIQVHI